MFTQLLSDAQSAWFNTEAMKFLLTLIYVFYGISNEREPFHWRTAQETTFTADLFFSGVLFPCEIMSALSHLQSPFVFLNLLTILIVQHLLSKHGK